MVHRGLYYGVVLVLAVLVVLLPAMAAEELPEETPPPASMAPVESLPTDAVDPGIDLPPISGEDMQTVIELLESINTYLTYLFMFGMVFLLVTAGKLVYSLFNMFF